MTTLYPYRLPLCPSLSLDAVVLAVPHKTFREKRLKSYLGLLRKNNGLGVLVDVRGVLSLERARNVQDLEVLYWTL